MLWLKSCLVFSSPLPRDVNALQRGCSIVDGIVDLVASGPQGHGEQI